MQNLFFTTCIALILIACSNRDSQLKSTLESKNGEVLKREVSAICKECEVQDLLFTASDTHLTYLTQVMNAGKDDVVGPVELLTKRTMLIRIDSVFEDIEFSLQQITLGKIDTLMAFKQYDEIKDKLKNGLAFADCAREYSKDQLGPHGGLVGRVSSETLPAPLTDVGKKFKQNETFMYNDLIFGWVVFKHIQNPKEIKHVQTTTITIPETK